MLDRLPVELLLMIWRMSLEQRNEAQGTKPTLLARVSRVNKRLFTSLDPFVWRHVVCHTTADVRWFIRGANSKYEKLGSQQALGIETYLSHRLAPILVAESRSSNLTGLTVIGGHVALNLVLELLGPDSPLRKSLKQLTWRPACCSDKAYEWCLSTFMLLPIFFGDNQVVSKQPIQNIRQREALLRDKCLTHERDGMDAFLNVDFQRFRNADIVAKPPSAAYAKDRSYGKSLGVHDYIRRQAQKLGLKPCTLPPLSNSLSSCSPGSPQLPLIQPFGLQELDFEIRLYGYEDLYIVLLSGLFPNLKNLTVRAPGTSNDLTPDDVQLIRRMLTPTNEDGDHGQTETKTTSTIAWNLKRQLPASTPLPLRRMPWSDEYWEIMLREEWERFDSRLIEAGFSTQVNDKQRADLPKLDKIDLTRLWEKGLF
ncbi:hypothetical protein OIO90_006266 [Microbotryomycetes sp. JL221]|nr:hypothetical protein OIO90_006266 [Microbotryomycetes sp. JL221]